MPKFYVGSCNITSGYLQASEKEAIEQAKQLVAKDGIARPVVRVVAWVEAIKPVRVRRVR